MAEEGKGPASPADDGLEAALDKIGDYNWWLWITFFMLSAPGIFNIWALTTFVFLAPEVEYWCSTPQLKSANWTGEQIKIITTGSKNSDSCKVADFNSSYLEYLSTLSFEVAEGKALEARKTVGTRECTDFSFAEHGTSIDEEWSLVCSRLVMKSTAQSVVAMGKFAGSFIFGVVADKWGRKCSFVISSVLYMVAGPIAGIIPVYWVFTTARFALGMAGTGCYNCGFTLLTEIIIPKRRTLLGILYNMSYAIGLFTLALIGYSVRQWRIFQLATSVPTVLLIVNCWWIPESPRWLLTKGRRDDAWAVVKKANKELAKSRQTHLAPIANGTDGPVVSQEDKNWKTKLAAFLKEFLSLVMNCDLFMRLLLCMYTWFGTALSYYALNINADNFKVDRYWYVAISGVVEAASYVIPIPILYYIGRRHACGAMYLLSGASLLCILALPKGEDKAVFSVAMLGRLCTGAVYSMIILYTSELFPTVNRNTAFGLSATMSHVGGIVAPFIVVQLGAIEASIPSTICGLIAASAGLLVLLLPETKGKKLCDTLDEVKENALKGDRVTLKNCCSRN